MDILDEEADPGATTWEPYEGPLWIDLDLNADVDLAKREGPLGPGDVNVTLSEGLRRGDVLALSCPGTDTGSEMIDEIVDRVFPSLAEALDKAWAANEALDEPAIDEQSIRAAIAEDVNEHAEKVRDRHVTFDEVGGLVPAETWYFRLTSRGTFVRVPSRTLRDFTNGKATLPANREGLVRLAPVTVELQEGVPVDFTIAEAAVQLRTDAHGVVVAAHRANAFDTDKDAATPLEERRNVAVRWTLTQSEKERLEATVARLIPGHVDDE